jgi:hypothetical protein
LILCGSGTASRMCGSASMEEPTGWMRRVGSALRPILGAVENARNLNRVGLYLIDDDVRLGRESELAPPRTCGG